MHYKNGREAKPGDKVICLSSSNLLAGIVHSLNAGSTACNARIAQTTANDAYVNLSDCLHVDDVAAASIPPPAIPATPETT